MSSEGEEPQAPSTGELAEELYAMSSAVDPVLAELWDNEKDAEYDRL